MSIIAIAAASLGQTSDQEVLSDKIGDYKSI